MRYYKREAAQLVGIRADQFKRNLRMGLYETIVGPIARDERGNRYFTDEQMEKLIEWYRGSAKPIRVIAMGGGVQTTAMLLMHLHGEWDPAPEHTIFLDLGSESRATYENLRWLKALADKEGHPFHWVYTDPIADDILAAAADRSINVHAPPLHIRKPDGGKGQIVRECTGSYKVEEMAKFLRQLLGMGERQLVRYKVDCWLGITTDEAHRMNNNSRYPWITNVFPLADRGMSREDCVTWLRSHGYPVPPKSACVFCPYRPNADWREMRDYHPKDWAKAIQIDEAVRGGLHKLQGELYLHQSMKPLKEAALDRGLKDGFGNECQGMCRV